MEKKLLAYPIIFKRLNDNKYEEKGREIELSTAQVRNRQLSN